MRRSIGGTLAVGAVAGLALAAGSTLVATLFDKPALAPVLIPMALTAPFTASTEVARLSLSLVEILFAPEIMHVFGEGFERGGPALAILAIGQLINVGTASRPTCRRWRGTRRSPCSTRCCSCRCRSSWTWL